jgi:hypothetical protein
MTSTDTEENQNGAAQSQDRELLLKVYQAAIDEYRFNVNLSWERTKFFLALVSGLIAAGVGLLRYSADNLPASFFLLAFFAMTLAVTRLARQVGERGKEYTQEAVYKKTLIERELGLLKSLSGSDNPFANLSISVTGGMRDFEAVLSRKKQSNNPDRPLISRGSIVDRIRDVLTVMIIIEVIGIVVVVINILLMLGNQ